MRKNKNRRPSAPIETCASSHWTASCAALAGLFWFAIHGGAVSLIPTHIAWLLRNDDWTQHYVGWSFFRNEPWTFPLGSISALGYPVGTNVALTDANPLVCLLLKLFSPWLPLKVQFIGPFMAICFMLQGWVAARVLRRIGANNVQSFLGACLFIVAPPLLGRIGHDSLVAHFTIVAALALCVEAKIPPTRAILWGAGLGLVTCCAAINPYLLAMVLPLVCTAALRWAFAAKIMTRAAALGLCSCALLITLGMWILLGYLSGKPVPMRDGFGIYTSDLFSFFNPDGWSRFLLSHPTHYGQREGFAYLGLGGWLIVGAAVYCRLRARKPVYSSATTRFLGTVCLGMALFALSDQIALRGQVILNLRRYTAPFVPLLSMFRSSGRFVWVPYYALLLWSSSACIKLANRRLATVVFAAALAVQLIDLTPNDVTERFTQRPAWPLTSPLWSRVTAPYKHLALFPPSFTDSQVFCSNVEYPPRYEVPFTVLAYDAGLTVNSGFSGSINTQELVNHCKASAQVLIDRTFQEDTVYIVHEKFVRLFQGAYTNMQCGVIDNYNVCVKDSEDTPLRTALRDTTLASR